MLGIPTAKLTRMVSHVSVRLSLQGSAHNIETTGSAVSGMVVHDVVH